MRDTNMGFTRHLAEQEEYLKHPDTDDAKYNKIIIPSKEDLQDQIRRVKLFEYYGLKGLDCDGFGRISDDENIAMKCILDNKQVPADIEERLLQRKKDRILNNEYSEIKK